MLSAAVMIGALILKASQKADDKIQNHTSYPETNNVTENNKRY